MKIFQIKKEELNKLPIELVEDIKKKLKSYDCVIVVYENGKYDAYQDTCLLRKYADDYKFIGCVYQDDIYTIEERKQNYKEMFGYDCWYL